MLYYASLQKSDGAGREVLSTIRKARELDAERGDGMAILRPLIEQLYEDAGFSVMVRDRRFVLILLTR